MRRITVSILFLLSLMVSHQCYSQHFIDYKGSKRLVDTSKWVSSGSNIHCKNPGAVGIGTDFPRETLHVNGSAQITGELNVGGTDTAAGNAGMPGQVLVSNGSGTAPSWKSASTVTVGDIKHGLQSSDHDGWVLLDGRAISALTPTQQARVAALGLSGNLPDAANAYLVKNGTTLGSVSGANTRTLTRNQLPNITLTLSGQTDVTGSHTHQYTDRGSSTFTTGAGTTNPLADNSSGTFSTGASGNHMHTVTGTTESLNGAVTQQAFDITPKSMSVNAFIYLGS